MRSSATRATHRSSSRVGLHWTPLGGEAAARYGRTIGSSTVVVTCTATNSIDATAAIAVAGSSPNSACSSSMMSLADAPAWKSCCARCSGGDMRFIAASMDAATASGNAQRRAAVHVTSCVRPPRSRCDLGRTVTVPPALEQLVTADRNQAPQSCCAWRSGRNTQVDEIVVELSCRTDPTASTPTPHSLPSPPERARARSPRRDRHSHIHVLQRRATANPNPQRWRGAVCAPESADQGLAVRAVCALCTLVRRLANAFWRGVEGLVSRSNVA